MDRLTPIDRIPPEVLGLVPDYWNVPYGDKDVIALTHVCRAWREIFISRSSLWTEFKCVDADKTRVYLERSNTSPINLWLDRDGTMSSCDPFFQIIPRVVSRLKSLTIKGKSGNVEDIAANPLHPAPLLERLEIDARTGWTGLRNPVLPTALFNGDLSSLRALRLQCVRTELPWRNMIDLTSFSLSDTWPVKISVRQFLDFFEDAPRLCNIYLDEVTPASGGQHGRLVSLACLERMKIMGVGLLPFCSTTW